VSLGNTKLTSSTEEDGLWVRCGMVWEDGRILWKDGNGIVLITCVGVSVVSVVVVICEY
jgi:hypothetical protein